MIHYLKISDKFADAVLNGEKTFEVRYNDRGYNKGDKIVFTVIDDTKIPMSHPLNTKVYEITYVLSGWNIKEDYVVFSIKQVEVVRCGDCKHSRTDDSNHDCYRCEFTPGYAHFASGFCESGEERK